MFSWNVNASLKSIQSGVLVMTAISIRRLSPGEILNSRVRLRAAVGLLVLASFSVNAEAGRTTPLILQSAHGVSEIGKREGYMLIYSNAAGPAPSVELVRLGDVNYKLGFRTDKYSTRMGRYEISLKNLPKGFYFAVLPSGVYQITKVNVPLFGLPYQLTTADRRVWRFKIERGSVNYVGELFIAEERKRQSVTVRLTNKIAEHFENVRKLVEQLPMAVPVVMGMGYRDDFLVALSSAEE